jgi:hypothetical protein
VELGSKLDAAWSRLLAGAEQPQNFFRRIDTDIPGNLISVVFRLQFRVGPFLFASSNRGSMIQANLIQSIPTPKEDNHVGESNP